MFEPRKGMKIAVGSRNPTKVEAVRRVMETLGYECEIIVYPVEPSVGSQPIGMEKVTRGAVERAYLSRRNAGADWGVGIEAGLIKIPYTMSGYMDFQVCVIIDEEDYITMGFGPGFEFPSEAVKSTVEGKVSEIEEVMVQITGIKNIGDTIGAVGFLSRGLVERVQLSKYALIGAIIPRLNPKFYRRYIKIQDILDGIS